MTQMHTDGLEDRSRLIATKLYRRTRYSLLIVRQNESSVLQSR